MAQSDSTNNMQERSKSGCTIGRSIARKRIDDRDSNWADLILVMEHKHKQSIAKQYRYLNLPTIIVQDIPNDY